MSAEAATVPPNAGDEALQKRIAEDLDSLHALPLAVVPLETEALSRARLIKNARLEPVIELYRDAHTGSGQVAPDKLHTIFGWRETEQHPDLDTVRALALLNSYDVYSLRIELRRLGIRVNDHVELKLSDEKRAELSTYMKEFTRPLIRQVYGTESADIDDIDQLIGLFSNPDPNKALANIRQMADFLQVKMEYIPIFLEEYGDIFLSLSYFQSCLDEIVPRFTRFIEAINGIRRNFQFRSDRALIQTCELLESRLNDVTSSITGRFESFDKHSRAMWDNVSAEKFREVRNMIESHHTTVGGVLCGLSVKLRIWDDRFGNGRGGPVRRAEFIMSDMKHGIDKIAEIESLAPAIVSV